MDPTVSVSKGVFVTKGSDQRHKGKKTHPAPSLFERCFSIEPWYSTFKEQWSSIENKLQIAGVELSTQWLHRTYPGPLQVGEDFNRRLSLATYSGVVRGVAEHVRECAAEHMRAHHVGDAVPAAALLTGVNQPDHLAQFSALTDIIRDEVTPHIATVNSQDASSIRHLVERAVFQLINDDDNDFDVSCEDDGIESPSKINKVRKRQCTMMTLKKWYQNKYPEVSSTVLSPRKKKKTSPHTKALVIIIPDFESFNCEVLQDFVTIVSSYVSSLPVVLVFGVATSVSALHKSFPYHVSSKLLIKVFQSHSSTDYLNQVLEEVFLTPACAFHLSGRAFHLFTDVFLFYDFSVTGFTQGIKYCMMDHFYGDNIKSLCCERSHVGAALARLMDEDLRRVRHLPSFRPYVEARDCRTRIALLTDDAVLREHVEQCLHQFHEYLFEFHTCLRVLFILLKDLPRHLLGKNLREFYARCTSEDITTTTDFKECMQLLNFQYKSKLIENLNSCVKILNKTLQPAPAVKPLLMSPLKNSPSKYNKKVQEEKKEHAAMWAVREQLTSFLQQMQDIDLEAGTGAEEGAEDDCGDMGNLPLMNRQKLKEQLLRATKAERATPAWEGARARLTTYVASELAWRLRPPALQPLHEVFVFADVAAVRRQVVGAPRAAVHTALNNPAAYLQCECCSLPAPDAVVATLPDTAVAYKLHRECGKLVNLYDWLQAFVAVLEPPDGERDLDERRDVPPRLRARFTRAVSELQFLGFIKASKRKTDHVTRLTW